MEEMSVPHNIYIRRACSGGGSGGVGCRGFRLKLRRFCVGRIRARFVVGLFKLLGRWKTSYSHALRSLKRRVMWISRTLNRVLYRRRSGRAGGGGDHLRPMLKSYGRSNSLYSEAIADCLDFIKRNSVSVVEEEEKHVLAV
ncbi:hypothetical protein DM860_004718 [Cuscuta australis]|uniref:Uncharacterized protein n=1 Tax=Cuscuta australis TaxID=267555 RepID=A0A328DQ12_9ASTE|nr:hypothetical protein DM860_004718 [Cuscuta australis]